MSKIVLSLLSYATFLLITSCGEAIVDNDVRNKAFFDLEEYFKKENERLKTISSIKKEISLDGKTEIKTISNPVLSNEFSIFINSDINKTSWLDKYSVDSLTDESGKLRQLSYTALDKSMKTQLVEVLFNNEEVSRINIQNATESILLTSAQELSYIPAQGFTIYTRQHLLFTKDRAFNIQVSYL